MAIRIGLLGLILAVPLIAFLVALGIQAHFNSELRAVLRKEFPNTDRTAMSKVTIDRLCENPAPGLRELCSTNRSLNLMQSGVLVAGAIGFALLLVIQLAGSAARNSRNLLLYLFKPGLYLTALTLIGLILVHAALAMAAIYYGESSLVGQIHMGIIGAIGLGALAGVFAMAKGVFSLVTKAQTFTIEINVSKNEAPELWNQVGQIADRLRALRPQHIVVDLDPNFFVTEANVICLNGNLAGRTHCTVHFPFVALSVLTNLQQSSAMS